MVSKYITILIIVFSFLATSSAQVEGEYYCAFDQYYPYCDDRSVPTHRYVFSSSTGKQFSVSGLTGFFGQSGFRLNRYKLAIRFGTGPEVFTSEFLYESGDGWRSDPFYIGQNFYTCLLKGTSTGKIDDPVFIESINIDPAIGKSSLIQYSAFAYNIFSKPVETPFLVPVLQYYGVEEVWKNISNAVPERMGGTMNISPEQFLTAQDLYTNIRFRIVKRIGNETSDLSYGNTSSSCSFYDTVNVHIIAGGNIQCKNSSFLLKGGYKYFPDASTDAFMEVKLATEPETAWKTITVKLTDTTRIFFHNISENDNWLGKEIMLRPYKMFNGKKICGHSINFMFLPEMDVSCTPISPKCFQATDGEIRFKFPALSKLEGKKVPIWFTIYKYDKYPLTDTGLYYKPVYIDNKVYYFNSGLTIQTTIADSLYILKSGTCNNQPYLVGAGVYKIKAGFIDSSNCMEEFIFMLNDPPKLNVSLIPVYSWGNGSIRYQIRTGESNAKLFYSITGGTKPYSYKLNQQSTAISLPDTSGYLYVKAGTQNYFFYDTNGCNSSISLIIRRPSPITISDISTTPVLCNNATTGDHRNGKINFTISGGVPPYRAVLNKNGYTINILSKLTQDKSYQFSGNDITTGTQYQIVISDTTVNPAVPYYKISALLTVDQPAPLIPEMNIFPARCHGEMGSINASATGGTGNIQYAIDSLTYSDNSSFQVDPGSNHIIHFQDDNLCSALLISSVPAAPSPIETQIETILPTCTTAKNGSIMIEAYGGTPYEDSLYEFFFPTLNPLPFQSPSIEKNALTIGKYPYYIQDENNCLYTDTIFLTVSTNPPKLNSLTVTDESCAEHENGTLSLSFFPGERLAPPYQILLTDSINLNVFSQETTQQFVFLHGLPSGSYHIKLTDQDLCSLDTFIKVLRYPNQLKLSDPVYENARCPQTPTGSASISASGGLISNNRYSFDLYDAENKIILHAQGNPFHMNHLYEGLYKVVVTDDSSCTIEDNFRISSTKAMNISSQTTFVKKKGNPEGKAFFQITNGNGSFNYMLKTYSAENEDSTISTGKTNYEIVYDSLYAGSYELYVMDSAGCLYNGSPWLIMPFIIPEPDSLLKVGFSGIEQVSCYELSDAKFKLSASGGWGDIYQYSLDSINFSVVDSFTHLQPGLYKVFARDTAMATASSTLEITEPDSLNILFTAIESPLCYGDEFGSLCMQFQGGIPPYLVSFDSLEWSSEIVFDSLRPGLYKIYLQDKNRCIKASGAIISSPKKIQIADQEIISSNCLKADGAIHAIIAGGERPYTFLWTRDSLIVSADSILENIPSGKYLLSVDDAFSCNSVFPFLVSDESPLHISEFISTPVSCYGFSDGTAKVVVDSAVSPVIYRWSESVSGNEIRGLPSGQSVLQITDAAGCSLYYPFTIDSPDSLIISKITLTDASCDGKNDGKIHIAPQGGTAPYYYVWSNGSDQQKISGLAPGNYLLTLYDSHGCTLLEEFEIASKLKIKPKLGPDLHLCAGNTYLLNGGIFSSYSWSDDSTFLGEKQFISLEKAGTYYLQVIDEQGCVGSDTLRLTISRTVFDAGLLAATTIEQGDTLILLEISRPLPDSVSWELGGAGVLAATPWSRIVFFPDTGTVELKITGFFGDCLDVARKTIHVVPPSPRGHTPATNASIGIFRAFPNPAVYDLRVQLELRSPHQAVLGLLSLADGKLIELRQLQGPGFFEIPLSLQNIPPGSYSLQLVAGDEKKSLVIIVH